MFELIRAIAMDFDGVLSDGTMWWGNNGEELKRVCFADVTGISLAHTAGIKLALISGESSPAGMDLLQRFADKVKIGDVYKGCHDKAAAVREFSQKYKIPLAEICFIGDDVIDIPAMDLVGLPVAPMNAQPSVKAKAVFTTSQSGGFGAVREVIDAVLIKQSSPQNVIAPVGKSTVKLSDYVMQFLSEQGVRQVFLLTGGGAMHLNDSLGGCSKIQYVCNLHEQACAIAAEAYAKYDNRLGVAMVTVGPGATNTITGIAGAWLDSTPVLFLAGQVKTADLKGNSGLRNRGVQEINTVELVRSITKYAVTVTDPRTIRYHLEKAVYLAKNGRPGPVWIDIPLDVQAASIETGSLVGFSKDVEEETFTQDSVRVAARRTLELLSQSERPFLWLGNGARLSAAEGELQQLLEALQVPFGLTWLAMDFVPDDEPMLMGRPGPMAPRGANFALQNSDFLLTIGARLDVVCTAFAPERLARGAKKVMVDIDPAELKKMEPFLTLPVCADARTFIVELLNQARNFNLGAYSAWKSRCEAWKERYPLVEARQVEQNGLVSMYYFTEVLCDQLPEGALIVPASSGNAIETLLLAFKTKAGQRVINTTGLGPMGFGLPASIGACLAHGGRHTVCIDGDGGFQMNIQELETIVRLQLPIKIFVINNGGYGSIVSSQKAYFKRSVGSTPDSGLTFPNTINIAAAYGIPSSRIADQVEVVEGVRHVLNAPGPHICEVMAIPDEPRQPRVSSQQMPDGSMVSKPLEDLFPFLPRDEFLENMIIPPLLD
jgi:acetolactate synthase I/II/III large subunit